MTRHAIIASTGRYVPPRRATNADIEKILGREVDQWLVDNVGIRARHFMTDDQRTSDLAAHAARECLERAKVSPEEIDLIIVATDTPDQPSPATATVVQHLIGARSAGTFDVNCACAAWVTALDLGAKAIVADSDHNHVLVIGAYGMSRFVDWQDKYTCTLFADGAGAVLLRASERPGYLKAVLEADGTYHDALGIYTGGTARPASVENLAHEGRPYVRFVKKLPSTFNLERWPALVRKTLHKAGRTTDDVALYIFTQLNLRTIESVMAALAQPMSKTHWTMDKWGYTGSACIPMTLDDAVEAGRLRAGDLVVLCASGGGIAMACAAFTWV
jgi:3-oxoacyl-[acyl-carrier-protein] synthase-3